MTYVSTSWRKEVSQAFMGKDKGMMIEFDKDYKNTYNVRCCDVSWISKFPDECDFICPIITMDETNHFECVVLDESMEFKQYH